MKTRMAAALAVAAAAAGGAAPVTLATIGAASAQYRPAPRQLTLTDADDGRSVRVDIGEEFIVRLPENAGTPYRWMLRNEPRIQQIGPSTVLNGAAPGVMGGRQFRTFRIRVQDEGRFPVIFALRSDGLGSTQIPARRVLFTIDAQDRGEYGPIPAPPAPPPPAPWPSPDRNVRLLDERDANFAVALDGREAEIRLQSNPSTGYRWVVVSTRDVTITRQPTFRADRPDRWGDVGTGGVTILHARNTRENTDGFLTLGLIPPGRAADRYSAVKTVEYHFLRDR